MANLVLGVRINPNEFQRIKIENVDLEGKVISIKSEAAKKINTENQRLELIYCGTILDDESTLVSYGIKSGVMIHVLSKTEDPPAVPHKVLTKTEIQQLVVAFRAFTLSSGYRTALQRFSRPEVIETIIAATPGLSDDPVALALIQDPDLLVHLSDFDTVKTIAELHPSLIEAANHIAAHVHEEAATVNATQPSTSTGYSYSLEALSDDEEMDSSSSDPPREGHGLTRNASYNAITAAQLASALANAQQTYSGFGPQQSSSQSTTASGNIITSEMFSNAIQQAFASVTQPSPTTPSNPSVGETLEAIRNRLRPQLQQMRDMGLTNEARNIRALQATSGDVQTAIDLVFNGVID